MHGAVRPGRHPRSSAPLARIYFPRENNLDWLRLLFAMQVAVTHGLAHLGHGTWHVLGFFPGVPAFFFASGFLIYASYRNAPGRDYLQNRVLRLMPALVFVTLGGLVVLLIARGFADLLAHPSQYAVWFLSQVTIGQSYKPTLFRDVGSGVINGSLWTITTEMLFYLAVPAVVRLERRFPSAVLALSAVSFAVYWVGPTLGVQTVYRNKTVYDIAALTPLVWGWMFGAGILAAKHFGQLARWIPYFPLALFPLAGLIALNSTGPLVGASGNNLGLLYFVPFAAIVLYLAFGVRAVALPFDLSYGVYVWHMPVINLILVLSLPSSLWLVTALTVGMAAVSWVFVERPALRLKRRALRTVGA